MVCNERGRLYLRHPRRMPLSDLSGDVTIQPALLLKPVGKDQQSRIPNNHPLPATPYIGPVGKGVLIRWATSYLICP
jgi:hypothetical protein